MQILYKEGETQAQIDEAHAIIEALDCAYPGHPWAVRVYEGGFFIRHLDFPSNWGMNCRNPTKFYSASSLKREVIRMAGEWLERANLKRGKWDETPVKKLEGVPDRFQPAEFQLEKREKELDQIVEKVIAEGALRTEPMPQVREALDG